MKFREYVKEELDESSIFLINPSESDLDEIESYRKHGEVRGFLITYYDNVYVFDALEYTHMDAIKQLPERSRDYLIEFRMNNDNVFVSGEVEEELVNQSDTMKKYLRYRDLIVRYPFQDEFKSDTPIKKESYQRESIKLPTAIESNFQITDSLKDVKNWKAKLVLLNSKHGDSQLEVGDFDEVGYVAVGLKTGTIVPIARQDEHQTGYELIHYYKEKKMIPNDTYITIFTIGNNYTYGDEKENQLQIQALKTLLDNGLNPNLMIYKYNKTGVSTIGDYVADGGFKPNEPKRLNKIGAKVIDMLEESAVAYRRFLDKENSLTEKKFVQTGQSFIDFLNENSLMAIDLGAIKRWSKVRRRDYEVEELANELFSHDGIKNNIHQKARDMVKNGTKDSDYYSYMYLVGDPETFLEELNRIGGI